MTPFQSPAVEAAYRAQTDAVRTALLQIREWVFETASATRPDGPETAPLIESLKWGEASYVPARARIGSPLRLARHDDEHVGLYVNCNTLLVEQFRSRFGDELMYSSNRAVLLRIADPLPEPLLRQCIDAAMTYHWRKRTG